MTYVTLLFKKTLEGFVIREICKNWFCFPDDHVNEHSWSRSKTISCLQ